MCRLLGCWAILRGRFTLNDDHRLKPVPQESALLTIDVQEDFADRIAGTRECLPAMRRVLEAYRERRLPIVHVVRLYLPDGSNADLCRRGSGLVAPGSAGAELVSALKPDPSIRLDESTLLGGGFQLLRENEWAMYKPRWDAFYDTPLDAYLRKLGVSTVSVVGCNFPNCPRSSIYGASMRDFRVAAFADAISGIYAKGIEELQGIGVGMLRSDDCGCWLAESIEEVNARR